ncbi:MAG TPA: hypothetical protein VF670_11350 [Duganella sp.]|jgi:hypothetical protein
MHDVSWGVGRHFFERQGGKKASDRWWDSMVSTRRPLRLIPLSYRTVRAPNDSLALSFRFT